MPLYFFDIVQAGEIAADEEGMELADMAAAKEEASASIREIVAESVRARGRIDDAAIHVRDENGGTVLVLRYRDVIS